jgi:hypothetical protein
LDQIICFEGMSEMSVSLGVALWFVRFKKSQEIIEESKGGILTEALMAYRLQSSLYSCSTLEIIGKAFSSRFKNSGLFGNIP